jgi:ankyrin repeat protein
MSRAFRRLVSALSGKGAPRPGALHAAAEEADADATKALLDAGEDPDARDTYRYTPLMRAVSRLDRPEQRAHVIELLLEAGADVNAVEQAEQTAIVHAAHACHHAAIARLLRAGADATRRSAANRDPLSISFDHSRLDIARILVAHELGQHERRQQRSARPLLCAAILGARALVAEMLASGAAPGAADGFGITPLHGAALAGATDVARLLLDRGADIDAQDSEGTTALFVAASGGQREVVEELVRRGADRSVRQRVNRLDDPACAAARAGNIEVLKAVLGDSASAVPSFGDGSILAAAAGAGHDGIVASLLDMGAPASSPGLLCAAAGSGRPEIARRLLSAGADPNGTVLIELEGHRLSMVPLASACCSESPAMVALLLEAGADPNVRDAAGDTPLLLLAERPGGAETEIAMAKLLVAAGADLNATGGYGRTAYWLAKRTGKLALAEAFAAAGADTALSADG